MTYMMQTQKRQKMCWNCEGAVSSDVLYCPYCGSDVQKNPYEEESSSSQDLSSQDKTNLSALYQPPYVPSQRGFGVPTFQEDQGGQSDFYYGKNTEQCIYPKEDKAEVASSKKTDVGLWPLLFLSMGMQLLTLGLLLFFFSDRGKLVLEWNSYYWFIYCILSCPFLVFGWKLLQSRSDQE